MTKLDDSTSMIDSYWLRACAVRMSVRVWRLVAGVPQALFTYAGSADAEVASAVLQQVLRLTEAVPGEWRVDVIAAGFDDALLTTVEERLGDLRRCGVRPRLALAPRLRHDRRAVLARAGIAGFGPESASTH